MTTTAPWRNLIRNGASISSAHSGPRMPTERLTHVLLTVEQVTGAPTAARLRAQFEVLQPTSSGVITDAAPGGIWTPVDADLHPASLPDGDWPTTIADQTTTQVAYDKLNTVSGSTAVTIGASATNPAPFVVGQRVQGTSIWLGTSNVVEAVGSAGAAGTAGSSATLRFPAIRSDSQGTGKLLTNPVQVKRSIVGFPCWRLILLPTFTGGTTPAFVITLSTVTE